jgi:hypothetical protein
MRNKKLWEELITYFLFIVYRKFDTTDHTENAVPNSSFTVACVFITMGKCLLSHCLAIVTSSESTIQHLGIWGEGGTDSEIISQAPFHFSK